MLALIAATDPALRRALGDAVRRAGHEPLPAEDGAAAWAAYEARRPPLVVVDLALAPGAPGGLDALALCRRVHDASSAPAELPPAPDALRDGLADGAAADGADDPPDDEPFGPFVLVTLPREGAGAELERALAAGADDYCTTPPSARNVAARLAIAARRMQQTAAARRAERALSRARWLAGIGETSIALQHEINNPLAALLGHAALLEQELDGAAAGGTADGEARELAQVVTEQAQRIATVMKRLAALRDPRSVEYYGGARMLDLSRPAAGGASPAPKPAPDAAPDVGRDPEPSAAPTPRA